MDGRLRKRSFVYTMKVVIRYILVDSHMISIATFARTHVIDVLSRVNATKLAFIRLAIHQVTTNCQKMAIRFVVYGILIKLKLNWKILSFV
jgi:hypothetical protein